MECKIVLCQCPEEDSQKIAQGLIEEQLAACVHILPQGRSYFIWEGELTIEDETLIVIKYDGKDFKALEERICELHPYDIPEILELDISNGHKPYIDWVTLLQNN